MASNSFFTGSGSSDHQNRNNQQDGGGSCRPSRKKSSKSSSEINKKKTPRRGMGVEKLERLINNNSSNKITASSCSPSFPPNYAFIPTTAFAANPSSGNGPLPMMSFSKYGGIGAVGGHGGAGGGGGGCFSLIPQQQLMGITGGGRAFFPNGQGVQQDISVDHVKGNSKELPSIPNLMQSDFCADCSKKKRHVRYACNKMVFDGVNPSFQDTPQGTAKVVALHRRKAASTTMGRENHQVVKEYDFFPEGVRKSSAGKSITHDELMMMKLGGTATTVVVQGGTSGCAGAGGEASCLTTTTAADDASAYIDLSLKLSY